MKKTIKFITPFQDLLGECQNAITSSDLLEQFDHRHMRKLIKLEQAHIKDFQKKCKKKWRKFLLDPSSITRLYAWARCY